MKTNSKAITIVELIVVITILAILGMIAFLSFGSYLVNARDSVRVTAIRDLAGALEINYIKKQEHPLPENSVSITASGTLIRIQGTFGKAGMLATNAGKGMNLDPSTELPYDYIVDDKQNEFQLITYLEQDELGLSNNITEETHASTGTLFRMQGSELGLVSQGGTPLHLAPSNVGNSFDIRNNSSQEYTIDFSTDDTITSSTGSELFSAVYNRNQSLLKRKELAQLDDSLVLYFDMETLNLDGTLKDFSQHSNSGILRGGPEFVEAIDGKGLLFDYKVTNQHVTVNDSPSIDIATNEYTILGYFQPSVDIKEATYRYPFLLLKRPWQIGGYGAHFVRDNGTILNQYCYNGGCEYYGVGDFKANTWYAYAGFKTNTTMEAYINGAFQKEQLASNDMDTSPGSPLEVGMFFEGVIDEVRIYNRALSKKEIRAIYGSVLK